MIFSRFFKKLSNFLGLSAPRTIASPTQKMPVIFKGFPSEFVDIVRWPANDTGEMIVGVNESFAYKSNQNPIFAVKLACYDIVRYIKPENLFFFFSKSFDGLQNALSDFVLRYGSSNIRPAKIYDALACKKNSDDYRKITKPQTDMVNCIVVCFCKFPDSEKIEGYFTGKQPKGGNQAQYYDVSWAELNDLQEKICNFGKHV